MTQEEYALLTAIVILSPGNNAVIIMKIMLVFSYCLLLSQHSHDDDVD
jgi:hypothetical protein